MKNNQFTIKNATHKDIDDLVNLLKQLFAIEKDFTFCPEKHAKGLHMMLDGCGKHRAVKIAIYKGKVVGMCTAQIRISTASGAMAAVFEDLVVDKAYRNNGIGCALLKEMYNWANFMDIQNVSLLADKNNAAGLDFYKQNGWKTTDLICLTKQC